MFLKLDGFTATGSKYGAAWQFFARAVLSGYRLELVPEPLFRIAARAQDDSRCEMPESKSEARRVISSVYSQYMPAGLSKLFEDIQCLIPENAKIAEEIDDLRPYPPGQIESDSEPDSSERLDSRTPQIERLSRAQRYQHDKNQIVVRSHERRLKKLLESASWRYTRFLREKRIPFLGMPKDDIPRKQESSDSAVAAVRDTGNIDLNAPDHGTPGVKSTAPGDRSCHQESDPDNAGEGEPQALQRQNDYIEELKRATRDVIYSRSWSVSAPFRKIGKLFRESKDLCSGKFSTDSSAPRICIVAPGTAKALYQVSKELNAAGRDVTVFHAGTESDGSSIGGTGLSSNDYCAALLNDLPEPVRISYQTYLFLKTRDFDIVVIPADGGCSYYSALAAWQGLIPDKTRLVVSIDAPRQYLRSHEEQQTFSLKDQMIDFMEEQSVKLAGTVLANNQKALDWLSEQAPAKSSEGYGQITGSLVQDLAAIIDEWQPEPDVVATKTNSSDQRTASAGSTPKVSVCIAHYNRPDLLKETLSSLESQDYGNFEVVLVDDCSPDKAAQDYLNELEPTFKQRDWQLIRSSHVYAGACRNLAARMARGEFLLIMDHDNIAKPHEISTLVGVALRTGADIIGCARDCFTGDDPAKSMVDRTLPLGPSITLGAIQNCFGDVNSLIRRDAFLELGGFSEEIGIGGKDWELFARAVLAGYSFTVVPEPLFYYRVASNSMLRTTSVYNNTINALRPYLQRIDPRLQEGLMLAKGLFVRSLSLKNEKEALANRLNSATRQ